jgi:hypothetical protein
MADNGGQVIHPAAPVSAEEKAVAELMLVCLENGKVNAPRKGDAARAAPKPRRAPAPERARPEAKDAPAAPPAAARGAVIVDNFDERWKNKPEVLAKRIIGRFSNNEIPSDAPLTISVLEGGGLFLRGPQALLHTIANEDNLSALREVAGDDAKAKVAYSRAERRSRNADLCERRVLAHSLSGLSFSAKALAAALVAKEFGFPRIESLRPVSDRAVLITLRSAEIAKELLEQKELKLKDEESGTVLSAGLRKFEVKPPNRAGGNGGGGGGGQRFPQQRARAQPAAPAPERKAAADPERPDRRARAPQAAQDVALANSFGALDDDADAAPMEDAEPEPGPASGDEVDAQPRPQKRPALERPQGQRHPVRKLVVQVEEGGPDLERPHKAPQHRPSPRAASPDPQPAEPSHAGQQRVRRRRRRRAQSRARAEEQAQPAAPAVDGHKQKVKGRDLEAIIQQILDTLNELTRNMALLSKAHVDLASRMAGRV